MLALVVAVSHFAAPLERRDTQCGAHSCYVALATLGFRTGSFAEFESKLGSPGNLGYSILRLRQTAESHGAYAASVRCRLDDLSEVQRPFVCVPLLRGGHFVALVAFDDSRAWIADGPDFLEMPRALLEARWPGECLLIATTPLPEFKSEPKGRRWPVVAAALAASILLIGMGAYWLHRRRLAALAAALFIGCGGESVTVTESKQPLAVLDAASLNLGKFNASAKELPKAAFRIRNGGDADLRLSKVILACTCAEARLSSTVVKPGDEARLTVALNSGAKMKSPSAQLRVHTNDPLHPYLELSIEWEVVHDFAIRPSELWFDGSSERAKHVEVHYNGAKPRGRIGMPALHFDRSRVDVRFLLHADKSNDKSTHWGDVVVLPIHRNLQAGEEIAEILLTVPPDNDRLAIPVRWQSDESIQATPNEIYAGQMSPGQRATAKVVFRSTRHLVMALKLIEGELADGYSEKRFDSPAPTTTQVLELAYEAPVTKGVFCKSLVFEWNGNPSLLSKVNIRGHVR